MDSQGLMTTFFFILIVTIAAIFLCCDADKTISVWVNVSANDDEIARQTTTFIKRELRGLPYVEVWDSIDAEWQLMILIIKVEINGNFLGYVASMSVARNSFVYEGSSLRTFGHQKGLEALCKQMITDFDIEYLASERN